jgi:phosphoribosylglycinamide formyltransferase 2
LPVNTKLLQAGASHVIKATEERWAPAFDLTEAVQVPDTKIRLFGKPLCKPGRRMGVVLATAETTDQARALAEKAAHAVKIID